MLCIELNDLQKHANIFLLRNYNINNSLKAISENVKVKAETNTKITIWLTFISRRIVADTSKSVHNGEEKPKVSRYL